MKPKVVSPSKLNIFLSCPKQYYFEYIDPEMAKIKKLIKKKKSFLEMGTFVHDALTLFLKQEKRTWPEMSSILKDLWKGPRGKEFGFESLQQEREYYKKALLMLKWFCENEDINPKIFQLPLCPPGNSFEDYKKVDFGKDLKIGGKLDRVDVREDGTLEIIDYKTGKEKDDNLQLLFYVFLVESLYKKEVTKASYLYLKSKRRVSVIPEKELREKTKEHILNTVEKIGQEKEFKPRISRLCAFCDYLAFCPARQKIKEEFGIETEDIVLD